MKRSVPPIAAGNTPIDGVPDAKTNGQGDVRVDVSYADLSVILSSLQVMRDGDFSVRLPGNWTGLAGKIADTFNEIVTANQQMAKELKRVGKAVGKEGRTRERMRFDLPKAAWGEMEMSVNTLVDDLLRPTTEVRNHREHDDSATWRVYFRSHARST
jgi:hypothetical protein